MHTLIAPLDTKLDGRHDGPDAVVKTEVSTAFSQEMHKVFINIYSNSASRHVGSVTTRDPKPDTDVFI